MIMNPNILNQNPLMFFDRVEFIDYSIDPKPKYSVAECKERDVN